MKVVILDFFAVCGFAGGFFLLRVGYECCTIKNGKIFDFLGE